MQIPQQFAIFPVLNASLNGASAVLIVTGRSQIKHGRVALHRACMIAAIITSALFFASYIYYHVHVGSVHFEGKGWSRPLYFAILGTHTLLALVLWPMVIITLNRALRGRFDRHRAIARWTYPIWVYVSVTGVIVYFMLYQWFAA